MNVTEQDFVTQVKTWLLAKKPEITDIDLDFDLIDNRVIDSLSFIEFVFFLEEITGRELQAEVQSIKSFSSLRAIRDNIIMAAEHD